MLLKHFHRVAICIPDGDLERHLSRKRVRGATEARIVGPESHLHHIQHAFGNYSTFMDQALGSFLYRHANWGVIIRGAYNQVDLSEHSAAIGLVRSEERR